jgi:HlyD family secretion protein
MTQNQAMLTHTADLLKKTTYQAPISGTVTYIAIRVGENVVPGIQNASGSYLMTISDMSEVTAEVMVDETDIANVRKGQSSSVTIDAVPGKSFAGHVIEVGTQAVLRSSGLASTQSTTASQEAKDFKVVVVLDAPPPGLRPGLSATAKTVTSQKQSVVAIPIQALAVRTRKELDDAARAAKGEVTLAAGRPKPGGNDEVQGVFVLRKNKAMFVPVETGIAGVSDIEVTGGLQEGDTIVTGSYKALRTLRPEATVKVDNSAPRLAGENPS